MRHNIGCWLVFLLALWFNLTGLVFAEKVATLDELIYPRRIIVENNRVFISDYPHIYIYSTTDYRLLKKFGGQGQGPGEFYMDAALIHEKEKGLRFHLTPDEIVVNSMGRLSFFTRQGEFKRMIRFNPFTSGRQFITLGRNFAAWENNREPGDMHIKINLYGPDLKKIKKLCRGDFPFIFSSGSPTKVHFFRLEGPIYETFDNKLFVSFNGIQEFAIQVFDDRGEKLDTISTVYDKIKLTEKAIQTYKDDFKYLFKRGLEHNLKNTLFPEFYPAIRNFTVSDGKIYVLTFKKQGDLSEFVIFDVQGNLLKKIMFPVAEMNAKRFYPYSIASSRFYQIVEKDEETWELHTRNLD